MTKHFIFIACLLGASAVVLGAFGAHILQKILTQADLQTYKTGVEYHFHHTFAVLFSAFIGRYTSKKWAHMAGWLFVVGILFFSGSLYLLSISNAFELSGLKTILGPMTPIGGLLLIAGWVCLLFAATKFKDRSSRGSSNA